MFPSPYGVTVIKSLINVVVPDTNKSGLFPSPYGVTVIKSDFFTFDGYGNIEFPSPYGVTVIKSYIVFQSYSTVIAGFRPLMG